MKSFANSELLASVAQDAVFAAFALILLLLMQITLLRLRNRWRLRRQQRVLSVWRPLLIRTVMGEGIEAPPLLESELVFFLDEWNRMFGVVRGEAGHQLVSLAQRLRLGAMVKPMLRRHGTRQRLLAIISLGHMQDEEAWDELLLLMQTNNSSLAVMAAGSLMQINSYRALHQVLPLVLERDWPWASVAHVLIMADVEQTCKILGEATKHAQVARQPGLLRYLDVLRCDFLTDAIEYVMAHTQDDRVLSVCLHIVNQPAALPWVRRHVDHPRGHVRCHAATALGRIGGKEELPLLLRLVTDREWWVRYRAAQAIANLPFITTADLLRLRDEMQDRYGRDTLTQVISEAHMQ